MKGPVVRGNPGCTMTGSKMARCNRICDWIEQMSSATYMEFESWRVCCVMTK